MRPCCTWWGDLDESWREREPSGSPSASGAERSSRDASCGSSPTTSTRCSRSTGGPTSSPGVEGRPEDTDFRNARVLRARPRTATCSASSLARRVIRLGRISYCEHGAGVTRSRRRGGRGDGRSHRPEPPVWSPGSSTSTPIRRRVRPERERLRILRGWVSSEGAVDSIQLVSRKPLAQVRTVAITPEEREPRWCSRACCCPTPTTCRSARRPTRSS